MTMKKLLLAGACAGLLAFSAAPTLAAGPMMPSATDRTVNSDTVQQVEQRGDRWRGHRHFHSPRHNHGNWRHNNWRHNHWRHRQYHSPRYGNSHWGHRHYYAPRYGYRNNYRPHGGGFGNWRW